jgi:hypothetical protein
LFGLSPPAQRPETFTTPAGENQHVDRIGHRDPKELSHRFAKIEIQLEKDFGFRNL